MFARLLGVLSGTLVALSEFESLDLTPDLSGVTFSQNDSVPAGSSFRRPWTAAHPPPLPNTTCCSCRSL